MSLQQRDEMTDSTAAAKSPAEPARRKPWVTPAVTDLPPLQNLTLQTGAPIGGSQSVFP